MLLGAPRIQLSPKAQAAMTIFIVAMSSVWCGCIESASVSQPPPIDDNKNLDPPTASPPDARNVTALRIQPERLKLSIGDAAENQEFVVEAIYNDSSSEDITSWVEFVVDDPSLGSMQGEVFQTLGKGGQTTLRAKWSTLETQAEIDLRYAKAVALDIAGAVPSNVANLFSQSPLSPEQEAPQLVYPYDGTLLPPNLKQMEVHFLPGASAHTLFRLHMFGSDMEVEVFTRCESLDKGCKIVLEPSIWDNIARTAAGREPITLTIEGVDENGLSRTISSPSTLEVTATSVEGALYYWTTTDKAIIRVDFGAMGEPEVFRKSSSDKEEDCIGCHAVSPDGKYLGMSVGGSRFGKLAIIDIASESLLLNPTDEAKEQFLSWSPDSRQFAAIHGSNKDDPSIRIRNGETGRIVQNIDIGVNITHVDWSPRGDRMAFTRVTKAPKKPSQFRAQFPQRGGISYIEKESDEWKADVIDLVLAEDGINKYTPTYAPTGEFLLYGQSECDGDDDERCDGDSDPTSKIWAVDKDGKSSPVFLTKLNAPGPTDDNEDLTNTFPRWAPFVDLRKREGNEKIMWVTFSSRRRVGLRERVVHPFDDRGEFNQLIWMAAISPEAIHNGEDGSFAPFALPFQDLQTSNHLAQWTQKLVTAEPSCYEQGASCEGRTNSCCGGLVCAEDSADKLVCQRDL